jgi:hypothetical protein
LTEFISTKSACSTGWIAETSPSPTLATADTPAGIATTTAATASDHKTAR